MWPCSHFDYFFFFPQTCYRLKTRSFLGGASASPVPTNSAVYLNCVQRNISNVTDKNMIRSLINYCKIDLTF